VIMKSHRPQFLLPNDVARLWNMSVDTVREDIRRGKLRAILTENGTRLIRRRDAERRGRERAEQASHAAAVRR
jgi:predicted site-specific integrase-resolvase